ncbi:MAG TPA: alanine-zipper protein [Solirubrobacterales bacterium]|nr:alanine-zipper protein [Solirubrobacterales bacterium]
MRNRYLVLGLSVVLALALAVPAMGGPSNPIASASATAKQIAKKALRKARQAQSTANTALTNANAAQQSANQAQQSANQAETKADNAQTSANSAQTSADAANANANNRFQSMREVFGTANPSTGTNTTGGKSSTANCGTGEQVTGGGYFVNGDSNQITVTTQHKPLYSEGWFATGQEISGDPSWSIQAFAECASK